MSKSTYRNNIIQGTNYKPLLHKKGKQWIVVGMSTLALAGFSGLVGVNANASTNTVKANINHNLASASAKPAVNPIANQKVGSASAKANITNQANQLHKQLIANNAKYQKSNVQSSASVGYNALAKSNKASSAFVKSVAPKSAQSFKAVSSINSVAPEVKIARQVPKVSSVASASATAVGRQANVSSVAQSSALNLSLGNQSVNVSSINSSLNSNSAANNSVDNHEVKLANEVDLGDSKNTQNDNVPVQMDKVDLKGTVALNFKDNKGSIVKTLYLPYDKKGVTVDTNTNNILNDTTPSAAAPADYINKIIQAFNTDGYTYDNNLADNQYKNVYIDPSSNDYDEKDGVFNDGTINLDFSKGSTPSPTTQQSDTDYVVFEDQNQNNQIVQTQQEFGKNGSQLNVDGIVPSGYQLAKGQNDKFTFDNGIHDFKVTSTSNASDNIPVSDNAVDVNGVITLHFHDGSKDIKDIELPYSGQTTANHSINILKNAEVQADDPDGYLNRTIKNFSTKGFKVDNNDNRAGIYNFLVNPSDATYLNGSTREMRKDITLNYSIDNSNDNNNSNLNGHNGTDIINFNFVDHNGNNHKEGSDVIKGKNGDNSPLSNIPSGYHVDPNDNNVNPDGTITIQNGNHNVNVLPNGGSATINYIKNGKKIASDTLNGNNSSAKGASDTSVNINSDYHPNLPSSDHINGTTNVPFDNGSHNIDVDVDGATDRIVYVASDGTSHGSDKINANLNSDIKINKSNEPGLDNGYSLVNSDNANNGNIFKANNQTYTVLVKGSNVGYNPKNSDATNKKFEVNVNVHKMVNGKSDGSKTVILKENGANGSTFAVNPDDNDIISQLPAHYLDNFTATGQDYTRNGKLTTNGIVGIPNNTIDFYYSENDASGANAITVNYNNGDKKVSSGSFSKPLNTTGNVTSDVSVPAGYQIKPNQNLNYKATDSKQTINIQVAPKPASDLPSDTNRGNVRLNLIFKSNGKWQNEVTQTVNEGGVAVGNDFTINAPTEQGYQLVSNGSFKGQITPAGANPGTHTFVYNAQSKNVHVHFVTPSDKPVPNVPSDNKPSNVNSDVNPNIPKGYHVVPGQNPTTPTNGSDVTVKIQGDKIVGTARVTLLYKQSNGKSTYTTAKDAQVVLHGEVGGSQTISPIIYAKKGYSIASQPWTINFTPSDVNANDQNGFSFNPSHTFEYDAQSASPVEVAYVDMDDKGNRKVGPLDSEFYPVVGHSDLGNFNGVIGQEVRLAKKGTGVDSDGTYYDLNVPSGYHLQRTYNPIILSSNPVKAQSQLKALGITDAPADTGMVLTVDLGANKPNKPNNPTNDITDTVNFMHGKTIVSSKTYTGQKGTNINYYNDIPSDYNVTQTDSSDSFTFNGGTHIVELGTNRPNGFIPANVTPSSANNNNNNKPASSNNTPNSKPASNNNNPASSSNNSNNNKPASSNNNNIPNKPASSNSNSNNNKPASSANSNNNKPASNNNNNNSGSASNGTNVGPNAPIVPNNINNNIPNNNNNNNINNNNNHGPKVLPNIIPNNNGGNNNNNNHINNNIPKSDILPSDIKPSDLPNIVNNIINNDVNKGKLIINNGNNNHNPIDNHNGNNNNKHININKGISDVSDVNDIKDGASAKVNGRKVVNITNEILNNSNRHYIYNIKGIQLHHDIFKVGKSEAGAISTKAMDGFTGRIEKAFKIGNAIRYEVAWKGHNYFVTGNDNYTRNAYIQPSEFDAVKRGGVIKHAKVVLRKDAQLYNNVQYSSASHVKNIKRGEIADVVGVKNIGRKGYEQTRLVLSNGLILTANKNYVKFI